MESNIIQLFIVLFLGAIATYDTVKNRRRKQKENSDGTGKVFNLQN